MPSIIKRAKTEDELLCVSGIGNVRKEYMSLADEYNKIINNEKMLCHRCGNWYTSQGFYTTRKNKTGYFHYACKECVTDMATDYDKKTKVRTDNKEKAQFVLKMMDLPYIDDLYNKCIVSANDNTDTREYSCGWIKYIRVVKSLPNYDGWTWANSQFGVSEDTQEELAGRRVTKAMRKHWGENLPDNDLWQLEAHYSLLKENNPNCDNNQEIFIDDLCKIKLLQTKAMSSGDIKEFDIASKLYRDTFKQAGLRTVTEKDESNEETLGVTLATISQYTPDEYYKNKKLYKDFDGLGEYIERFMLRPLRNLQFGNRDRDRDYSIEDIQDEETEF